MLWRQTNNDITGIPRIGKAVGKLRATPSKGGQIWPIASGSIALLALGFGVVGWWTSDARSLEKLSQQNQLHTPQRVFRYVTQHWHQAKASDPIHGSDGIQAMLARPSHRLWCDEGAIVLALMNQRLGFQTRLIDLLDAKTGISHHTTLQVKQAGHWVTFDFTSRRSGIPLSATVPYQAAPRYRPYPATPLHWFLHYNGFARDLVRQLRASPKKS